MYSLPPLVAGEGRWILPAADASAAALVGRLLADDASAADESLAVVLSSDPPLLLWTVCTAARKDNLRPRCVDDVARWLTENVLEVLQWEDGRPEALRAPENEAHADRVAAALEVAELAARLVGGGRPAAELPFLLGLLHNAGDWLGTTGDQPAGDVPTPLPRWLTEPDDTASADAVKLAARILSGEASVEDSAEVDLEACRRRAAAGRRRWLASAGGIGNWVPSLTAKLARLAALETKFQKTLEAEKLEAMAEFAAGAGHEINNPLTVITGRAQLFLREETDPERRRALALISAQAMRVYEMIADMRLFARPPQPELETIDLVELVDQLLEDLSPGAARQEITLCRIGEDGPVELEADPTQLTVALRAICRNAIEAIGRGGHIEIGVQPGDREVDIRVSDDGPGIPAEERCHLFDPFYSARQAGRGLGLGLSKCWRIVTNHGGRIDADSQPGHGATFTITLPRHA